MTANPPAPGLSWQSGITTPAGTEIPGRWVFQCACGRAQGYAPPDRGGGVTEQEAEHLGWRKVDGQWVCPFCTGNTSTLAEVFGP